MNQPRFSVFGQQKLGPSNQISDFISINTIKYNRLRIRGPTQINDQNWRQVESIGFEAQVHFNFEEYNIIVGLGAMQSSNYLAISLSELLKDHSKTYNQKVRFFLEHFKTSMCYQEQPHSLQNCFGSHSDADARRNPYINHTFLYFPSKQCSCSDEVPYSLMQKCPNFHNQFEKAYHPSVYRKFDCIEFQNCKRSFFCPFAHTEDIQNFTKGEFFRFDLNTFKTQPCNIQKIHERDCCLGYHNQSDRRRSSFEEYSHVLCGDRHCNNRKCKYAHNKIEQLYHPSRYKSKFCRAYQSNKQKCAYGEFCSFAHRQSQIAIEIIHLQETNQQFYITKYKTIWCPFTNNHDRSNCVYAHNFQDYRRNPREFKYKPERCERWNFQDQIKSIQESGCNKGLNCDKCHGWIEQRYHPLQYRKNKPKKQYEEEPMSVLEQKLGSKQSTSNEHKQKKGAICSSVGAPFFKNDQDQSRPKAKTNKDGFKIQKEISCASKKTKARTANISSDKSNEGSCNQTPLYQLDIEPRIGLPIFQDEDKVWRHNLNDNRWPDLVTETRYRSQEKSKQQGFGISYSTSLRQVYFCPIQMLQDIGIEQKLRRKKINEVKIINLDEQEINSLKFLNSKERGCFSRRLRQYVLKRQLKKIQYSWSLTNFFLSKQWGFILEKMKSKKVKEQKLLQMKQDQIEELSFLSEEEKEVLPKMLREYTNQQQFLEIKNLILTASLPDQQ